MWYSEGLRFECTGCGACCSGEPGYVWVTRGEIKRIARYLELSEKELARRYLRLTSSGRVSLREKSNGDCVFLERPSARCVIYPVRPVQCRTYPFWPEILRSKASWQRESLWCPGIGRGRLFPARKCKELAEETTRHSRHTARSLP